MYACICIFFVYSITLIYAYKFCILSFFLISILLSIYINDECLGKNTHSSYFSTRERSKTNNLSSLRVISKYSTLHKSSNMDNQNKPFVSINLSDKVFKITFQRNYSYLIDVTFYFFFIYSKCDYSARITLCVRPVVRSFTR